VWETGLIETLKNNLREIKDDKAFRELVKKVSEWVLKKAGSEIGLKGAAGQAIDERLLRREYDEWFSGARAEPPVPDEDSPPASPQTRSAAGLDEDDLAAEIESELDNDPDFQDAMSELHNASYAAAAATRGAGSTAAASVVRVDERALKEMFPDQTATTKGLLSWYKIAKFIAKVSLQVLRRHSKGRDHGTYCTIVEEVLRAAFLTHLGATVWNQMKNDTADSFKAGDSYAGTALLAELKRLQDEGKSFSRIALIGHSTGAIYICRLIEAAAQVLPEQKFDVFFLAPAVTFQLFADTIAAHPDSIANFRMFSMSDELESQDQLVRIVYTRSLLYFISGVLEGSVADGEWQEDIDAPLVGMKRYLDERATFTLAEFPAIHAVKQFFDGAANRTIWSEIAGGDGLSSASRKHGDFDNDPETVKSLMWVLQNGF
jgi:hypothetical protein